MVLEPTFIKTYDGKSMVFLKVCHMILDAYGINVFIDDLFNVYNCLKDNQPLPEAPKKFEDLIKKDLIVKHDEEKIKSDYDYFTKVLTENPEPYYLGLDGGTNKIASKCRAKNIRPCKMLFVRNKTKLYGHGISKEVCDKLIAFATEHNTTIANLLMYLYSVTQSRVNNDLDTVLQLELCNMRGTLLAKKCSGTKVQSLSCVTKIDKDLSFEENLKTFVEMQSENYRHIGMGDLDMQILHHSIYKTSMLYTYYSFTFSFIPYRKNGDVELQFYSNGRCALPVYAAVMYDYENNEIGVGYDCQERLVSEQNIKDFHNNLLYVIEQVIENPTVKVKDIKLK